jgi:hypothetical protein
MTDIKSSRIDYDKEEIMVALNDRFSEFVFSGYREDGHRQILVQFSLGEFGNPLELPVPLDSFEKYIASLSQVLQSHQLAKVNIHPLKKTDEQRRWEVQHYDEIQREYLKKRKEMKNKKRKSTE